jgi:glutathione S-transferase
MILFGASVSPFVRKVMMFAAEKGITLENRQVVPTTSDDPDFLAASPLKKIPAFKDGDYTLADSTAIVTYLEAKYPAKPLLPAEARARGKAIWFEEYADTIMFPAVTKLFFNRVVAPKIIKIAGDQAAADEAETRLVPALFQYLEGVAPADGFLAGDSLSVGDIAVVNMLINLDHSGVKIDAARHPRLAAYYTRIATRPSVAGIVAGERKFLGL